MFKRLRDGLFKRQEADQEAVEGAEEAQPQPDETLPEQVVADDAAPPISEPTAAAPVDASADVESVPAPLPMTSAPLPVDTRAELDTTDGDAIGAYGEPEAEVESAQMEQGDSAQRRGFFNPFKLSLGRTRQLFGRVNESLAHDEEITEDLWDELEETLISSDVGVQTTERIMNILRERASAEQMTHGSQLRGALKEELELLLGDPEPLIFSDTSPITVLLMVGVNGVGKTTSIAKLANLLKRQKHRVMLAAGDTFRAAAVEQLKTWGERVGVPVIAHQQGVDPKSVADPAAVVYDAMQAAQARGTDVLIVDTAGRLHTKSNLMDELKKIVRVLQKYDPEAPHEVLLVLDATTGQNGLAQAKQFVQDSGVSGVILTKLDGTARGGIVFAIASELGLPIKYIGTGERVNDIAPFNVEQFINALFDED